MTVAWFFNTAAGRFLLTALIVLLCWWGFSTYYFSKGEKACQDAARGAYIKQEVRGRDVAKTADTETAMVVQREGAQRTLVVTEIKTVYRDRPAAPPIVPGSCVYPVDPRVQAALQAQLDRANGVSP